MKLYFKNNRANRTTPEGFSLVEMVTALIILSLVSSSVLLIIDRCLKSTADMTAKMRAFEVARENMEELLSQKAVKEKVDYGTGDKYPEIEWETVVGTFYDPLTSRMWVRAICKATYEDTDSQQQEVELTHWLTNVTKRQAMEILKEKERREQKLQEEIIPTYQGAAEYAEVDVATVEQWVANGMPMTESGFFTKSMLSLFKATGGYPPANKVAQTQKTIDLIEESVNKAITAEPGESTGSGPTDSGQAPSKPTQQQTYGGYTMEELNKMSFAEVWKILMEEQKSEK